MSKTPFPQRVADALKKSDLTFAEQVAVVGCLETFLRTFQRQDFQVFKQHYGEFAAQVIDDEWHRSVDEHSRGNNPPK